MDKSAAASLGLALFLGLSCAGCTTKQDPDVLRQKAADTTANLKQDTKALAQGIREGMGRNSQLDLNTASAKDLAALPGITPRQADRIIAHRPYARPDELVAKNVLSRSEFNRIQDKVTAKP